MKKWPLAVIALSLLTVTSCSDDEPENKPFTPNLQDVKYDSDNIWEGWNKKGDLIIGDLQFSHQWTEWSTSQGFVAAKISDTGFYTPMYEHQFEVITGGGVDGKGTPYIVANWNSSEGPVPDPALRSCVISHKDGKNFNPQSMYITNAAYPYYSMIQGDDYAKKFSKGDKLILHVYGVTEGGTEKYVNFYLADCRSDNPEEGVLKTWEEVDLSSLGTVKYVYFTMESTDIGQWGMNTPAYFAIDKFTIE